MRLNDCIYNLFSVFAREIQVSRSFPYSGSVNLWTAVELSIAYQKDSSVMPDIGVYLLILSNPATVPDRSYRAIVHNVPVSNLYIPHVVTDGERSIYNNYFPSSPSPELSIIYQDGNDLPIIKSNTQWISPKGVKNTIIGIEHMWDNRSGFEEQILRYLGLGGMAIKPFEINSNPICHCSNNYVPQLVPNNVTEFLLTKDNFLSDGLLPYYSRSVTLHFSIALDGSNSVIINGVEYIKNYRIRLNTCYRGEYVTLNNSDSNFYICPRSQYYSFTNNIIGNHSLVIDDLEFNFQHFCNIPYFKSYSGTIYQKFVNHIISLLGEGWIVDMDWYFPFYSANISDYHDTNKFLEPKLGV